METKSYTLLLEKGIHSEKEFTNRGSILLSSRMPLGECEPQEAFITQLQIPPLLHSGICYWAKCRVRERGRRVASRNLLQS